MTESEIKKVAIGYFEEAFVPGNKTAFEKYVAEDVVRNMHGKVIANGLTELIEMNAGYHANFTDWHCEIPDLVIQENKIAIRFKISATHVGEFHGIAGTNKRVVVRGTDIFHIRDNDGKIITQWAEADMWDLERQMRT